VHRGRDNNLGFAQLDVAGEFKDCVWGVRAREGGTTPNAPEEETCKIHRY
jgi:hypothetical protein